MSEQPIEYESRADPPPRWPRLWSRRTSTIMLLMLIGLPLLPSILVPTLHTRRNDWMHGHGGKCMSNLRQVGLAIQPYANGNRGRLPPDLATVMIAEDLTSEVFDCPSTNHERATGPTTRALLQDFGKPGHCSYTLAAPLPQTWTALTPAHVFAYESPGNHFGSGTNVLFGDGRCEFLPDAKARHLIAELKAGFNPPRKPR